MKRMMKKLTGIVIALTMLFSAIPASAAISVESDQVLYMTSTSSSTTSYASIYVSGLSSSQKITQSSVKSSKTSVASVYSLDRYASSSNYYYYESKTSSSSSGTSSSIGLKLKKAGTATISFKIGSKTYKSKITVKSYTNPVKSITISGVNSSKTFASKTKSSNSVSGLTLSKTTKNAKISVTAKSGWKVRYISLYNSDTGENYSYSNYSNPKTSASMNLGTLTKGKSYSVYVTFVNTSNGASLSTSYTFS
ncbi:MAG: hypothetical protein LUI07_08650 [Lachnospiraceae bacterium]|nr:hypothetical protein [Lachnospiraceae bacterium]